MTRVANEIPVLTLLVLLPVAAAIVLPLLPRRMAWLLRANVVFISILEVALVALLLGAYKKGDDGYQFLRAHNWLSEIGVQWKLGVDGASLFLVVLTALAFPVVMLALRTNERKHTYFALLFLLEAGLMGAFLAVDLFLFFVCFEVVLVPMYFLIAGWGFAERKRASLKFVLYTLAGSAFMLVGIVIFVVITAQNTNAAVTFDLVKLQSAHALTKQQELWVLIAFLIAFAVKVPMVPLHSWIGDTYKNAPFAIVALSSAVVIKLGAYGILRFCVETFPSSSHHIAKWVITFATVGIVYGALVAVSQRDLRGLLAYSSVSHLGYVVLGLFAFQELAFNGAVLQMVSHGLIALLFTLLVAALFARTGTTEISALGGLQARVPVLGAFTMFAVLATAGVPGFSSFAAEFLVLMGTFVSHRWWAVVAAMVLIVGAIYVLWAYQRVFHGPCADSWSELADLSWRERVAYVPLVAAILLIGIYPAPFLDRVATFSHKLVRLDAAYVKSPVKPVLVMPQNMWELPTKDGITSQQSDGATNSTDDWATLRKAQAK